MVEQIALICEEYHCSEQRTKSRQTFFCQYYLHMQRNSLSKMNMGFNVRDQTLVRSFLFLRYLRKMGIQCTSMTAT